MEAEARQNEYNKLNIHEKMMKLTNGTRGHSKKQMQKLQNKQDRNTQKLKHNTKKQK